MNTLGNIRRSRGYSFEHMIVQRLNSNVGWHSRRLGGSSTGLPDIVAVNNDTGVLLTIEAKSGTSDILYVPQDQVQRCKMIMNMFSVYPERHIILAFKFMNKKRFRRKNGTVYESRKLVEHYKVADIVDTMTILPIIKCTYQGKTSAILNGKTTAIDLPDYSMPFQKMIKTLSTTAKLEEKPAKVMSVRTS